MKQSCVGDQCKYARYEMGVYIEALIVEVAPAREARCYGGEDGTIAGVYVWVFAVPLGDLGDG